MKKVLFAIVAAVAAGPLLAGVPVVDPYTPTPVDMTSDSDATGAIFLLAMVGLVIASAQLTGRAKAPLPEPIIIEDAEDN